MAKTAAPMSRSASASNLASTSASTPATTPVPDPASEAADAINQIYSYFYRGGVAYTYNTRNVARYYCKACLEHEIQVVREAREQFGQGASSSTDVLRDIALGRIEFYLPKQTVLANHLTDSCPYFSKEERAHVVKLKRLLSHAKLSKVYFNPYDYGALYDAVQFPKYADLNQDIQPGSASPAHIFAAHEATLLTRARKHQAGYERSQRARSQRGGTATDDAGTEEDNDEELYDSDDFTEAQVVPTHQAKTSKNTVELDTSKVYKVDADDEHNEPEVPADFPSSDLLKALQQHAGNMYAKRGLMSTEKKPKTEDGERIPSMIQAFDGSALVALGILTQELAKAQVVRPHQPQPISDFYERKIDHKSVSGLYGYKKRADKEVISRILEKLPEGSTVGLAGLEQDQVEVQSEQGQDGDTEMES